MFANSSEYWKIKNTKTQKHSIQRKFLTEIKWYGIFNELSFPRLSFKNGADECYECCTIYSKPKLSMKRKIETNDNWEEWLKWSNIYGYICIFSATINYHHKNFEKDPKSGKD